jgi:selenide,water dikinase
MPEGAGTPVKPIGGLLAAVARFEADLPEGARVVLVGGGASGTELALALADRFRGRVRLTLICDTPEPLASAPPSARAAVRAALAEAGVELVCGVRAGAHGAGRLTLSDGSVLDVSAVLWATDVTGPKLLAESGLACDGNGCVLVDTTLRSRCHDIVFAAGDCATITGAQRPKAGVWAVRAGPVLDRNLRRAARGLRPRDWHPPAEALAILGLGGGRAVAWRNGLAVSGRLVSLYKDWIDRRFLRRYGAGLPSPVPPATMDDIPLDAADLTEITSTAAQQARRGIVPPAGARLVQHVIHLTAPLDDPFSFGRIAAAHALVGLHAAGARPWTAAVIVTPPIATTEAARTDTLMLLQGAESVLSADGVVLAACATASGTPPALGLTLTGLVEAGRPAANDLRAGDALILTKPLGSGLILEAHRRGQAEAQWLLDALATMAASSADAARILRHHGATGSAAVAEDGLVGALAAMLRAANLTAALYPDAIPALPGARVLSARGVAAPKATANRLAWPDAPDRPEIALLTDPQLAGGLLAGVPSSRAPDCLIALAAAGYDAAIIGLAEIRRLDVPRMRLADSEPDNLPEATERSA